MSAAKEDPLTVEEEYHKIEKLIDPLEKRMIKVSHRMEEINTLVDAAQTTSESYRRIQKERQRTLRARTSKHMKDILRRHMIFNHDIHRILRKYTSLIDQIKKILESFHTSDPPLIADVTYKIRNIMESLSKREELYKRISEEYPRLKAAIENTHGNETNNDNSNMNTTNRTSKVHFSKSTVRRIPHRGELIVMKGKRLKAEGVSASSLFPRAASLGGSRRTLRKRTRRNRA